jgi:SAM-dependent methyltransferase
MKNVEALWFAANRANWDERVPIHRRSYEMDELLQGKGRLHPIEEGEFSFVAGERILHLQCHFGRDTLTLAQRGAQVVGVDFSAPAIEEAQRLSKALGLGAQASFVQCDVYCAPENTELNGLRGQGFDRVFVSWGAINWLPDIDRWAQVVSWFLRDGGSLYLADAHPTAYVFEDGPEDSPTGRPQWFVPYFDRQPAVCDNEVTYTGAPDRIVNTRTYEWLHPISAIVSALLRAGMSIDMLHEHAELPWQMFRCLVSDGDSMYRWPDRPWLPLAFSLQATKRA